MKRLKAFIFNNIYMIFTILFVITSSIFFLAIRLKLNNIVNDNSQRYVEANELLIIIGVFIFIVILLVALLIYILRCSVLEFSNSMCDVLDKVISKEEVIDFDTNKENLQSKLQNKLKQLVDIINNDREQALLEKNNIKALISDISHQIKTPIANITMYNDTLIERELNKEQQNIFLNNMKFQVSKLEWLVQSLIKMSRLESNLIKLTNNKGVISETIANALSGVYIKAEEKNIGITVSCPDDLVLSYDKKWTSEAVFNILENAVKYTNKGGCIEISVDKWELFTKMTIKDTGIGIDNNEINNIFKRFYRVREVAVAEIEGIGIGLYLANEIITRQGGYIKVESSIGQGSTFSVFLKN